MSDIGSQGGGGGQKVSVDFHKLMGLIAHMFGGQAQAGQAPGQGMPMPGMVGGQQQSNIPPGTFQTPPGALTGNGPMPQQSNIPPGSFQTPPGALTGNGPMPQPAPGGGAPPGTGQRALMARGSGSPGSTAGGGGGMGGGAMPFMGGAMPQGGMGGGQGGGTYKSYAATPPNLPPPPTIDDALGMVEQVAGAGGFRFGPGSGLDSRGPAIMQALAMLQNQYKEQVGGMLGVFKGNVEQAGDLNQQQTAMVGQRGQQAHQGAETDFLRAKTNALNTGGGGGGQGGSLSPSDQEWVAQRLEAGDTGALAGLGYGKLGSANRAAVIHRAAEDSRSKGGSGADVVKAQTELKGQRAAMNRADVLGANLSVYGREAFEAMKVAREASHNVNRLSFVPVNELVQNYQKYQSNPELAGLYNKTITAANTYAKAINPTGQLTVEGQKIALSMLSMANSQEAYDAQLDAMEQEILNTQKAIPEAQKQISSGKPVELKDPAMGGKKNEDSGPKKISSDADYAKLPSGAEFIGPDGRHRRKP
jgi:hypothetical protein